jgi:hypothetical protein
VPTRSTCYTALPSTTTTERNEVAVVELSSDDESIKQFFQRCRAGPSNPAISPVIHRVCEGRRLLSYRSSERRTPAHYKPISIVHLFSLIHHSLPAPSPIIFQPSPPSSFLSARTSVSSVADHHSFSAAQSFNTTNRPSWMITHKPNVSTPKRRVLLHCKPASHPG